MDVPNSVVSVLEAAMRQMDGFIFGGEWKVDEDQEDLFWSRSRTGLFGTTTVNLIHTSEGLASVYLMSGPEEERAVLAFKWQPDGAIRWLNHSTPASLLWKLVEEPDAGRFLRSLDHFAEGALSQSLKEHIRLAGSSRCPLVDTNMLCRTKAEALLQLL
jgi:hypothetical protein